MLATFPATNNKYPATWNLSDNPGIQSCISQLTQDKAICTCSRLLKFFHNFYLCFFQDAACKRPPWTEDHFSRGSFVWREDSTWVGVGINNQIQRGGGGGGAHEKFGWRTVLPRPSNSDCFRQKSFILLSSPPPFCGSDQVPGFSVLFNYVFSFCG